MTTPPAPTDRLGRAAIVLIALAPLVFVPGGMSRFVLPKLAVAAAALGLAALARPAGRLPRAVALVLISGGVWLVVAAAAGDSPWAQLVGRWPRYEGLVALPLYAGSVWAGARLLGPGASAAAPPGNGPGRRGPQESGQSRTDARAQLLTRALSAAVLVAAVVALAESFGLRPLGGDAGRPGGLIGNASQQAALGAVVLAVLLPTALRRLRSWETVGVAGAATLVVVSGSRAGLLAAVAGVGVVVVVLARRPGAQRRSSLAIGGATLGLIVLGSLAGDATRGRLLGTDELAADTVAGRWQLWGETVRILFHRPVLGAGPSGFFDLFAARSSDAWRLAQGTANPVDSPHNVVLQAALAGGVVLVALAVALLAVTARETGRAWRADGGRRPVLLGAVAGLVAGGVCLLTGFTHASTTPLLGVLLGTLVALPPAAGERRWPPRAVAAAAAIWAAFLTAACAGEVVMNHAVGQAAVGQVEEASHSFEAARRLRSWDPDVPLLAAQAFSAGTNAGDPASASAALMWTEQALRRTPASRDAVRIRAVALGALGRPDEGLDLLNPLLADDPHNLELLLAAGTLEAQSGRLDAALSRFLAAVQVAPDDETAWYDLEVVARMAGDQAALDMVAQHAAAG